MPHGVFPSRRREDANPQPLAAQAAQLEAPSDTSRLGSPSIVRRISQIHTRSRGTYGAPRIHAQLRAEGVCVGRKRVARLMREAGLQGVSRRRKAFTTRRDSTARPAPDLVDRQFHADAPNKLWVADITYIPTWEGFAYLAVVLDVWSRKVVGWAMEPHLRTELVLAALNMALAQRNSSPWCILRLGGGGCSLGACGMSCRLRGSSWGGRSRWCVGIGGGGVVPGIFAGGW